MPYHNDVFISYSSIDKDWAAKLETDLTALGLSVWRDQSNLTAGAIWEDNLMTGVRESQHLVVLWSKNAAMTDWVRRERSNFEAVIATPVQGQAPLDRLMIFVMLDDENLAYPSLQVINEIKNATAYAAGVNSLDPGLWQAVINKVVLAIQSLDKSTPIPTAVLAATRTEIQSLPQPTLDSLVSDLGLGDTQTLFDRYGVRREDWRPFGSNSTIKAILATQQNLINTITTNPKFRWEYVKEDFWTDMEAARRYADTLRERPSLIIIDPVSLNLQLIYKRANILKKCLTNDETAVMVPMPFSLSPPFINLRTLIKDTGAPFFDEYYDPPVHEAGPVALFGMNIGDEADAKRLLLAALAPYVRKLAIPKGSPYTRQ